MKRVYMTVDGSGNWTTYRPDGSVLSNVATLQPGVDYAIANHVPFIVDGDLNFPITEPVVFGEDSFGHYDFRKVGLIVSGDQPAVTRKTHYGTHLRWTGYVDYRGTASEAWLEKPAYLPPLGVQPSPVTEAGESQIPSIWIRGGTATSCFCIDAAAPLCNESFFFDKLNGGLIAAAGIKILNPAVHSAVAQNRFVFNLIAATTSVGVQEGSGVITPGLSLGTNYFMGSITCDAENFAGYYATFGVMSLAEFPSLSINQNPQGTRSAQYGVIFNLGSDGNYVIAPQIQAGADCLQNGTRNKLVTPPY